MSKQIIVLGCGGIGGVLAARLTRAGLPVTPVTGNPEIATALARDGFQVQELDGSRWSVLPSRAPIASLAASSGTGPFDLCLSATKATMLAASLQEVLPHLAPGAPVICCQNGLPEGLAADVIGPHRTYGAVVGFGASMLGPGRYELTSGGGLQVGRADAAAPPVDEIAQLLGRALSTRAVTDLAGVRWSKLAINCATSTIGLLGGARLWPLLQKRFIRRLVLEIWSEVVAVARQKGIVMAPVGGTLDIARLALSPADRAAALGSASLTWKHSVLLAVGVKYRKMRSSMLIALERGRQPEIDFLNGEIVRQGEALGVPTPVNRRLVRAVHEVFARRASPSFALLRGLYEELVPATRGIQSAR